MTKKRLSTEELEELLFKNAKILFSDKYLAPVNEMCGERKQSVEKCFYEKLDSLSETELSERLENVSPTGLGYLFEERMKDFQPTIVRDEDHVKELLQQKKERQERCKKAAGLTQEEYSDD